MAKYDVFISYKSEHESWARRLDPDLRRFGYRVFRDHGADGLEANDENFATQLTRASHQSGHFIVLWSADIPFSSYVVTELADRKESGGPATVVLLDDTPTPDGLVPGAHHFREFLGLHERDGADGAELVSVGEWNKVVRRLVSEALPVLERGAATAHEVPFAIVAMTNQQATELNDGESLSVDASMADQILALCPDGKVDPARYGTDAEAWQPFELDTSIAAVLDRLDGARRSHDVQDERLLRHWPLLVSYTNTLLSPAEHQADLDRMRQRASLIIVDCLSLLHKDVMKMLQVAKAQRACIIGLGPLYGQPTDVSPTDRAVSEDLERQLFDEVMLGEEFASWRRDFYPGVGCTILNVANEYELASWVHLVADHAATWTSGRTSQMHAGHQIEQYVGPSDAPGFAK